MLYGSISYFDEETILNIVDPKNKLPFLLDQKVKKEIQLHLTKLIFKLVDIKLNKIEAVAILSWKKKYTWEKRRSSKEIVETIFMEGLQDFCKYGKLNTIEIKIDNNKILAN